jgi:hypothetical protein
VREVVRVERALMRDWQDGSAGFTADKALYRMRKKRDQRRKKRGKEKNVKAKRASKSEKQKLQKPQRPTRSAGHPKSRRTCAVSSGSFDSSGSDYEPGLESSESTSSSHPSDSDESSHSSTSSTLSSSQGHAHRHKTFSKQKNRKHPHGSHGSRRREKEEHKHTGKPSREDQRKFQSDNPSTRDPKRIYRMPINGQKINSAIFPENMKKLDRSVMYIATVDVASLPGEWHQTKGVSEELVTETQKMAQLTSTILQSSGKLKQLEAQDTTWNATMRHSLGKIKSRDDVFAFMKKLRKSKKSAFQQQDNFIEHFLY